MKYKHSVVYLCFCVFSVSNVARIMNFNNTKQADDFFQNQNIIEYRVFKRCCEDSEIKIFHCPVCRRTEEYLKNPKCHIEYQIF